MIGIAIHGGALKKSRNEISSEMDTAIRSGLDDAVEAGWKILNNHGSAWDAVTAVVCSLEDNPLFNAARGSALTKDKTVECDASVMRGDTLQAGSVCNVTIVKNPILAARAVMEQTSHVMLCGTKADDFAKAAGLTIVRNEHFVEPHRTEEWLIERNKIEKGSFYESDTVGAVALDSSGNLAAATSTGGLPYRMSGRIGDSPVIGAGTYANNDTCAISFTGEGEKILRGVYAKELSCLMHYKGLTLEQAANEIMTINEKILKAEMGLASIDKNGNIVLQFNTLPMYRAFINPMKKNIALWNE